MFFSFVFGVLSLHLLLVNVLAWLELFTHLTISRPSKSCWQLFQPTPPNGGKQSFRAFYYCDCLINSSILKMLMRNAEKKRKLVTRQMSTTSSNLWINKFPILNIVVCWALLCHHKNTQYIRHKPHRPW